MTFKAMGFTTERGSVLVHTYSHELLPGVICTRASLRTALVRAYAHYARRCWSRELPQAAPAEEANKKAERIVISLFKREDPLDGVGHDSPIHRLTMHYLRR